MTAIAPVRHLFTVPPTINRMIPVLGTIHQLTNQRLYRMGGNIALTE
jgi:hypothetical protein